MPNITEDISGTNSMLKVKTLKILNILSMNLINTLQLIVFRIFQWFYFLRYTESTNMNSGKSVQLNQVLRFDAIFI